MSFYRITFSAICFSIFIFKVAFAQQQNFKAGLIAGLTTSQVDGDRLVGFNKVGVKAGGYVNRKIAEKFSIQFEIEFIQKGSRRPLNTDDNTYYLMRLNYLEAPLMLNYFIDKKWSVEAGVSVAALASSLEENEIRVIVGAPPFHKYDYLANAGFHYVLSEHLVVNARVSYSIVPMRTLFNGYGYYYSGEQYNKVVAFALEYSF